MGKRLVWEKRFNIGVEIIDKEHEKLFRIINRLFEFSEEEDKSSWVCQEGIKYFKGHALKHFAEEEGYMESISYKELETHRRLHQDFRQNILPALEHELEESNFSQVAIDHFLGVCTGWLIGHTLTEDHAIVGKKVSKWKDLRTEKEQSGVVQTITQLLKEMFQLEAQVISECYGGEKFGQGVYYRLVYGTEQRERQEIILVFEERLLLETVGKILGDQSGKLDVMEMNATRYVAKQFVECIKERFTYAEDYRLKSEDFLTYEQFEKAFDRQQPQHSLLFNTGSGYFAYCAMAPNTKSGKAGVSIRADNAMIELEEYLAKVEQEKNSGKKKLLLVDDSMTIRHAMKELLKEDYQITLAESGISAIRCLTLERPDLVLLDYEMPVCDGAQVLEMIRSETAFADVPVIFLTSRGDRSSINKVIPFKPDGYFLKSTKPGEIKKNIDDYFAKKGDAASPN